MPLRHCERSEAIHLAAQRKTGLLRRCAPLRKRLAFVAGNDGVTLSVIASAAKQSMPQERMDCFVAALPCANASRLSQAMTKKRALPVTGSAKQEARGWIASSRSLSSGSPKARPVGSQPKISKTTPRKVAGGALGQYLTRRANQRHSFMIAQSVKRRWER